MVGPNPVHVFAGQALCQMHMGDDLTNPFQFGCNDIFRYPGPRNGRFQFSAQTGRHVKNHGLAALKPQLPGRRDPGGSAADNGNFGAGDLRQFRNRCRNTGPSQTGDIHGRHAGRLFGAGLHAKIGTQISAYAGRERRVQERQVDGFIHLTFPDQAPPVMHRNAGRAGSLTGGPVFPVFPDRYMAS